MKMATRALLQKGLSAHTFKKTHTTKSLRPQCSIKSINTAPVKCNEPHVSCNSQPIVGDSGASPWCGWAGRAPSAPAARKCHRETHRGRNKTTQATASNPRELYQQILFPDLFLPVFIILAAEFCHPTQLTGCPSYKRCQAEKSPRQTAC